MRSRILALLFLAFLPAPAFAGPDSEAALVAAVTEDFRAVMRGCPGRIWPGYSWRGLDVAVVRKGVAEQTLLRRDGTVARIASSKLGESALGAAYEFLEVDGRQVMTLNASLALVDETKAEGARSQLFRLGVHEAFHLLAQRGWKEKGGARGTEYPVRHEPRLQRSMLFSRLLAALGRGGAGEDLGRAAFWLGAWSKDFPGEALSATDGYEGTAKYADLMAELLRRAGCAATESELRARLPALLKEDELGRVFSGEQFTLDGEGYDMGALAALVLRFHRPGSRWEAKMASGATPVEALLAGVAPVPDAAPPAEARHFEARGREAQAKAEAQIGGTVRLLGEGSTVRVGMRGDWVSGAESLLDSYLLTRRGYSFTVVGGDAEWREPGGSGRLRAKEGYVFVEGGNPCGADRILLLPASAARRQGNSLQVSHPGLGGSLRIEESRGPSGEAWLCAGPKM